MSVNCSVIISSRFARVEAPHQHRVSGSQHRRSQGRDFFFDDARVGPGLDRRIEIVEPRLEPVGCGERRPSIRAAIGDCRPAKPSNWRPIGGFPDAARPMTDPHRARSCGETDSCRSPRWRKARRSRSPSAQSPCRRFHNCSTGSSRSWARSAIRPAMPAIGASALTAPLKPAANPPAPLIAAIGASCVRLPAAADRLFTSCSSSVPLIPSA